MVYGYTRVSTDKQNTHHQEDEILRWAHWQNITVDHMISESISSKKIDREIYNLLPRLKEGDIVITSEISRIARSTKELLTIVEHLIEKKVRIVFLKENIDCANNNPAGMLTISILASIAQFERSMVSLRTKESLAGRKDLGRKVGSKNSYSKLDPYEDKIKEYLGKGLNKTAIAKLCGVTRATLYSWAKGKGIVDF